VTGLIYYNNLAAYRQATTGAGGAGSSSAGTGYSIVLSENPQAYWEVGAAPSGSWLRVDLGVAATVRAWALLNNNLETNGVTTVRLKVGTLDNGTTFDLTADTLTVAGVPDCEPNAAAHSMGTIYSKRYWRVEFTGESAGLRIGELMLFGNWFYWDQTPDAPFTERFYSQYGQRRTEGGHVVKTRRGGSYQDATLNWANHDSAHRDDLETLWEVQRDLYPFIYVDHRESTIGGWYLGGRCVTIRSLRTVELSPGDVFASMLVLQDVMTP